MKEPRTLNPWKYRVLLILEELSLGEEVAVKMEMKSTQRKRRTFSQNKDEYLCLHWISHVLSLKTPKDMFDALNNMYEDDLENSTQEFEGANVRKHSMITSQEYLISRIN